MEGAAAAAYFVRLTYSCTASVVVVPGERWERTYARGGVGVTLRLELRCRLAFSVIAVLYLYCVVCLTYKKIKFCNRLTFSSRFIPFTL